MKKLQSPLPIAEGRAIVQLSSGEYVCVDTHTLDSIPYLIGLELEPEIIRVFRTFLTRRSVVLDIGANVGLYTALLSTAVRRYGRLFAFEGPASLCRIAIHAGRQRAVLQTEYRRLQSPRFRQMWARDVVLHSKSAGRRHDVRCPSVGRRKTIGRGRHDHDRRVPAARSRCRPG